MQNTLFDSSKRALLDVLDYEIRRKSELYIASFVGICFMLGCFVLSLLGFVLSEFQPEGLLVLPLLLVFPAGIVGIVYLLVFMPYKHIAKKRLVRVPSSIQAQVREIVKDIYNETPGRGFSAYSYLTSYVLSIESPDITTWFDHIKSPLYTQKTFPQRLLELYDNLQTTPAEASASHY